MCRLETVPAISASISTQQIVVRLIRRSARPLTAAPQHQLTDNQVPAGVGQLGGELGHVGSTGSVAIGVGYAQRHRGGGRKGAHFPGAWVNRSAMTHSAAGWLPMPKWLA